MAGDSQHQTIHKRININRPAYSEDHFQQIYQETTKEHLPVKELVKRRLSRCSCTARDMKELALGFFPIARWLPEYDVKGWLLGDVMAGLTVGVMRLPQGMAYGILATLAPVYGLYTVFFPALIYSIMGTSMHLSIGSFAVVSIMTGTAVEKGITFAREEAAAAENATIAFNEEYERARIASTVAFLCGFIQIGLGLLRLGFISTYLALPLVRGFTTGAAVYVFDSQFKSLFGIRTKRYEGPFAVIKSMGEVFSNLHTTNTSELFISVTCIIVLVIVKELQDRYMKKFKYPIPIELIVIIIATAISYAADFEKQFDVNIIGNIPIGLPSPQIPPMKYVSVVITDAFTISIVTFSVAVSMGFIFAKRNDYEIDPNQELYAIGASNVFCSFFMCYPAASSLSRSLLQEIAGGKTQIAGTLSCMLILLVLLFMGPLFQPLPKSVLAAIVVVALRGMFRQFHDIKVHWKYSKIDCLIWLVTFGAVSLLGADIGLGVGVVFAIFTVVVRTQHPKYSIMGKIPGTDIYRDTQDYQMVEEIPQVKIFSVQCPIYYANGDYIKDSLYSKVGVDPLKIQVARTKAEAKKKKQEEAMKKEVKKWRKLPSNEDECELPLQKNSTTLVPVIPIQTKDMSSTGNNTLIEIDQTQQTEPKTMLENAANHKPVHVCTENNSYTGENQNCSSNNLKHSLNLNHSDSAELSNGDITMEHHEDRLDIHTVILDLSGVSFVDVVGINILKSIVLDYQKIGVDVMLTQCKPNIQHMLYESGCMDTVGRDRMYLTLQDAVLHTGGNKCQDERCDVIDLNMQASSTCDATSMDERFTNYESSVKAICGATSMDEGSANYESSV